MVIKHKRKNQIKKEKKKESKPKIKTKIERVHYHALLKDQYGGSRVKVSIGRVWLDRLLKTITQRLYGLHNFIESTKVKKDAAIMVSIDVTSRNISQMSKKSLLQSLKLTLRLILEETSFQYNYLSNT